MEEIEQSFQCPYCFETISMLLDMSLDGVQSYIEDCEVCCRPIHLSYEAQESEIVDFSAMAAQ